MAKLHFKYSSMNAGKTIDLIRSAYNYEEKGHKVYVLKPGIDTKGDNYILSRIGLKRKVDFLIGKDDSILDVLKGKMKDIDCILVDEAQFLTSNQVMDLLKICKSLDIPVLCYGLRTNFMMESFEGSKKLLEVADKLEEIITLCECGKPARFNARMMNNKYVLDGEEVLIDENKEIKYIPLCGKCFLEKVKKVNTKKIKKELI